MDYVGYIITRIINFLFNSTVILTMSEKRKSTSPSSIQVKNRRNTIVTEKLDVQSRIAEAKELLTYAVVLDSLMVVCFQYVIMLITLKKVLRD